MPKSIDLTLAQVNEALSYEPDTGKLIWRISPAKNVKAGTEAGSVKGVRISRKTGEEIRYRYVRLYDLETPAARVVWLLYYGEWPKGNIQFKDGDSANLRITNLQESQTLVTTTSSDGLKKRTMSKEAQRHYGLKRYYGISVNDFAAMLLKQNGVCAICDKPETAIVHGKVKPLSVDHNHETGAIRELLCSSCNHLLGHAREDREVLLSALKYLDKHSGRAQEVSLHVVSPEKEGKRE